MPLIRKQLKPSDVYPDNLRYNEGTDTVQSLINGEWVDNPDADPRQQTTLPPRITDNPACDAAQSVVDALEGQISDILTAIDNAGTVYTIAGLILGLLAFGPFGVFIGIALFIADQMLSAGTTALEAALTPAVYEDLKCIIFCQMDSGGRIDAAGLGVIEGRVNDDIGGLGATILNAMLSLAGEGGVNNLASLGTSDGDCSGCDCPGDCYADKEFVALIGTYLGNFDGYDRFEAAINPDNGLWTIAFGIATLPSSVCCQILDQRDVVGSVSRQGHVACGGTSLTFNWNLGSCGSYWFSDQAGGANETFTIEILLADC